MLLHHTLARSSRHPAYEDMRVAVPDALVLWTTPWPEYTPVDFTHNIILAQPAWADPMQMDHVDMTSRMSFEGPIAYDAVTQRPLNPRGRTGTTGRGILGKWGPNHAADPIVIRRNPAAASGRTTTTAWNDGTFQMVAIKRKDTGEWAIPGGMVDPGEHVSLTLRREFTEETGAIEDADERAFFEAQLDTVFADGRMVYEGYVDDPRNTDNAWLETTVHLFFVTDGAIAASLKLVGGDDASHARWLTIDDTHMSTLYADHITFVQRAVNQMSAA